ncbi:bifunctional DNA primase/polymerase [Lactobacillus sp. PV034]|uniref:bifunctional DNA primase/polymerase n=1 Tax=Lactobacillus sp. PV034 TaxID=2594495 RepID=UPI002240BEE0|nr:bifunctional DNA primase/polymerase [Lactobacillus sp. PV034]QNQ80805.1 DNA primase [Lactobacillus sp. PV034]
MLQNLVNYAVDYAEKGFSVIPIGAGKKPLIKFAGKPALTPDEIRKIWQTHPLANIALKTDKFFVVDVDRHGDVDGLESIKKINHDEWFKDTLTEKTAHDGYHFYFQKPANGEITQNIGFLPGVDLKAHVNNYVVVAPSALGDKQYKWLNQAPMKPAPQGLLDLLKEKADKIPKTKVAQLYVGMNKKTKTTGLFETIIEGFGDTGQRNDSLASFMGGLLLRNVDPEVAAKLAVIANENTPDPLPMNELERTVNSMIEKEARRRSGG